MRSAVLYEQWQIKSANNECQHEHCSNRSPEGAPIIVAVHGFVLTGEATAQPCRSGCGLVRRRNIPETGVMSRAHDHVDSSSQFVFVELIASDTVDGRLVLPFKDLGPE